MLFDVHLVIAVALSSAIGLSLGLLGGGTGCAEASPSSILVGCFVAARTLLAFG